MKQLIPTLLVALFAVHASAQIITTLKSYRFDSIMPVLPPEQLVRGDNGTLYGINHSTIFRLQPDGSGFSVVKQSGLSGYGYFAGRPAISGNTLYGTTSTVAFLVWSRKSEPFEELGRRRAEKE